MASMEKYILQSDTSNTTFMEVPNTEYFFYYHNLQNYKDIINIAWPCF